MESEASEPEIQVVEPPESEQPINVHRHFITYYLKAFNYFRKSLHVPGFDDRRDFPATEAVSREVAKQSL